MCLGYFFNPSIHIGKLTLLGQFSRKLCIESSMFDKYEYHKYFSSVSVVLRIFGAGLLFLDNS